MITITTINNSYYFIGNLVIQPNNSAVVDETILSYQNLRDIVLAEQNKRITLSNTDLNAVKSEMNAKDGKIDESSFKTINGESIIGSGDLVLAGGSVDSVQGRTGVVVINKADVGLSDVNNTSDLSKPISTAQQTALNLKANSSHTHVISEVTNLTTELNSLSGSDILSGAILGNNLVLTLKNNNTINIDVTQFVEDLTVVSGAYDPLTESIIFELSDLSTFSVPVSALLPVTTDGLTIQGNGGSTSLSVKIDTGLNNRIIIGAGGLRTDSILSNTTESYTTSDKNLVNDIPDIKNDILTKQNTLIPGANIDITGDTISVVGLGSGTTNLSVNRSNTAVTIVSDTGADAIIAPATSSLAGVMVASDKVKLDGIQTNATANSTDSFLLDRNNHTGTQLSSTISDFNTNVDSRINSRIQDQIVDGVTLNAPSQNAVFDALSNKSNLGHNHSIAEITNLQTTLDNKSNNDHIHTSISITDFDVAVRTAVVEDQIIDGVINKAPSQNSVFDALANKANSIHTHSTSQITDFNASVDSRINTRISNTSIDELNDVNTTNKSNGQVLTYNTVTSQWSPATPIVYGDMFKSTYDTNDNGVIDNSERLNNQLPTYYLSRSNHTGTQSAATITGLTSASVGLGNVDNTSDANKPISTATQTALNGKSDNGHAHAIADVTGLQTALNSKEATVTAGTTAQYYRGDKSWQTLDGTAVGLGAVVNQDTTTTANITDSTNKRFVSDAQLTVIGNTSNTNTGDETQATIKTKLGAATTLVDGYLTSTNFNTFNDKEPALAAGTTAQYYRGDKSWQTLNKASVGLTNADDTSDANKPISTATQTALNGKEGTITPGTTAQYYRGDKSWQTLNSAVVGLGNADNTSDANKPISTATQTALNGKEAAIAAGTTGQYWRGDKSFQTLDKSAVGLGNVDNTSDVNKPVSTLQASADSAVLSSAQSYADGKVAATITNGDTTHAPSSDVVFDALALKLDSSAAATTYQPLDSQLTSLSGLSYTGNGLKVVRVNATADGFELGTGGGALNDGDMGDIVVSGTGTILTIDAGVVDTTKLGGDITVAGKALLDDASASAQRTTLGLGNVDNTSDANKPVSTAQATADGVVLSSAQSYADGKVIDSIANADTTHAPSRNAVFDALALKQDSLGFTPEDSANKQSDLTASATKYPTVNAVNTGLSGKEPTITSGTTGQYWRGDKSWQTLDKTAVGLGNVDNTSDASKPISTLTQTALNAKEGTITAGTTGQYYRGDKSFQTLNSAAVGLGSVANVDTTNAANITSGLLPLGRLEVPLQLLSDATFNNDTVLMYTNNRFDSLPLTSSEDNMLFNYSGSGLNINAKYGNHPNNPYFSFMEHFIGTSATSTVSPYFLRTVDGGTTAAVSLSSDTDTRMGVLRLGAGALFTSGAALSTSGMQSFNFASIPNGGYYETGCRFQLPILSDAIQTFSLVFGFGDATTAQPVDGVFLRHTTNTVVGRLVANSVITDIAIPNITNLEINTNYILKIRVSRDNSGVLSATFKLNGNEVTTSSGIPTGVARQTALQYAIIKSDGVIDRFVELDWIYFERYFPEISNY